MKRAIRETIFPLLFIGGMLFAWELGGSAAGWAFTAGTAAVVVADRVHDWANKENG